MSAERLREAAALMRSRAKAATSFSDAKTGAPLGWVNGLAGEIFDMGATQVAQADDHGTARHIASWHPAVALAVADLLDAVALVADHYPPLEIRPNSVASKALALADAYLGGDQ